MKKNKNNKKSKNNKKMTAKRTNSSVGKSIKKTATKTTTVSKTKKFPETAMKESGTIYISEDFKNKIDYLHKEVGSIEWSGILSYKKLNGDFENPKDLEFLAEDIIPMDVGTSTYTEYSMDEADDYADPKVIKLMTDGNKMGHCHTHHSMKTFFSGTDTDELHENAPNHNYYLSLIVNFEDIEDWKCKVCFVTKVKSTSSYALPNKGENKFEREYETLVTIDLEVLPDFEVNNLVEESFSKRIAELKKPKNIVTTTYGSSYAGYQGSLYDWGDWEYESTTQKDVKQTNNYYPTNKKKETGALTEYKIKGILASAIKAEIQIATITYTLTDTIEKVEPIYKARSANRKLKSSLNIAQEIIKKIEEESSSDAMTFLAVEEAIDLLGDDYDDSSLINDLICDLTTELYSDYE